MFRYISRTRIVTVLAISLGMAALSLSSTTALQAQAPDPATLLYVKAMGVSFSSVGGPRRLPLAVVDITDGVGLPVNGALVVGNWTDCIKQNSDSALTQTYSYSNYDGTSFDVDGRAEIWANKSCSCWGAKQKCYFVFTVTGVLKDGMTYVPVAGYGTSWSEAPCF
jgi:hypothetical protein